MIIYQPEHAGLHLVFPTAEVAEEFRARTLRHTSPATVRSPSLEELQGLGLDLEEDVTAAYQRSFGQPDRPMCDFLYRCNDQHSGSECSLDRSFSFPLTVASSPTSLDPSSADAGFDDGDDMGTSESDIFYDASEHFTDSREQTRLDDSLVIVPSMT